jgi:O-antigen/teichoic acid export membrane protein
MSMTDKPILARSVVWNYVGYIYETAIGIVLVAYVVRHVGMADYGVFLLASSVSGLLMLLDLGLPNLLVQAYIAEKWRSGVEGVSRLLSTTFFAFALLGSGVLLLCGGLATCLPGPFHLSSELLHEAVVVLVLSGVTAQLALPTRALDTLYESSNRFDTLNRIQLLIATFRAVATVGLVRGGYGIVALAWIQVAGVSARLLILSVILPRSAEGVRLSVRLWNRQLLKPLWRPGSWALLDNAVRQAAIWSDALILGIFGSMGAVAVYGVGSKAPFHLSTMVYRGTAVILPAFAGYHTAHDIKALQRVYLNSCRVVLTVMLPVALLGIVFADSIIKIWVGAQYREAAAVMQWLLLATLSQAMESPSDQLLYARGHVATAARIATVGSIANLALGLCLVARYGGVGLAAATAITHSVGNILWFTPTACRAAGLKPSSLAAALAKDLALPVFAMSTALIVILVAFSVLSPFDRILAGALTGLLYLAVWMFVTGLPVWRAQREMPD